VCDSYRGKALADAGVGRRRMRSSEATCVRARWLRVDYAAPLG
jgi:hypothetical protein